MKNVLLISPSQIIFNGLKTIFEQHSEFRVTEYFSEIPHSASLLRDKEVDLTIVDPSVLDYSTRSNVRATLGVIVQCPVLVIKTLFAEEEFWKRFDGVMGPYDSPSMIINECRRASQVELEDTKSDAGELSAREKEILVKVAQGKLNKEIADELNLSVYTVMTHRKNITKKTGIRTVAGLVVYAMLNNLLDAPSTK